MLIKTPLLHQSSGPRVFLSLSPSLFFRLMPWSAEALWVHFPARASKTLLRRCSMPSPHREGAGCLREESKPHAEALLAFCVNHGISASFSPLLSYHWLRTTRSSGLLKDLNSWCQKPMLGNCMKLPQNVSQNKKQFPVTARTSLPREMLIYYPCLPQ